MEYEASGGISISGTISGGATKYFYNAIQGLELFGCANFEIINKYRHLFAIGSVVFNKDKALKQGKLESVAIKKVEIAYPNSTYSGTKVLFKYTDTYNSIWFEDELVWQAEAVDLATAYWEDLRIKTENALMNC